MFCPECGSEVQESAKFCWSCGKSLNQTNQENTNGSLKQPLKVSSTKTQQTESREDASRPYFSEKEGWIFTAVMTIMLIAMTIWAFATAK